METLQERLLRHEGIRTMPYRDTLGKLTIGVGRCLDTEGITEEEALYLLDNDISHCQAIVRLRLPWVNELIPVRQDILTEMCFQLGINGLLAFKNMLACAESGDNDGVASNMLSSQWHTQTPARCEELAKLWLNS